MKLLCIDNLDIDTVIGRVSYDDEFGKESAVFFEIHLDEKLENEPYNVYLFEYFSDEDSNIYVEYEEQISGLDYVRNFILNNEQVIDLLKELEDIKREVR